MVETLHNSKTMERFSRSLFDIWDTPFAEVDLEQLNTFEDHKCLISITNYINSPISHLRLPILIRNPIPAALKYDKDDWVLGWVFDNRAALLGNSTRVCESKQLINCYNCGQCAMLSFHRLTIQSKLWTCQIRVDLFPPIIGNSKLQSELENLWKYYKTIHYILVDFGLPSLWEIAYTQSATNEALVGPVTVLRILMISQKLSGSCITEALMVWTRKEYVEGGGTYNNQFVIINLIETNNHVYSPTNIFYINRHNWNDFIESGLKTLAPKEIFKLFAKYGNVRMHWEVMAVDQFNKYFGICGTRMCSELLDVLEAEHNPSTAEDMLHKAVIHVWQSILKNRSISIYKK